MKNLFNRGLVALAAVLALSACDLDLTNPNALSPQDTRTPAELLDVITSKGREVDDALAALRRLVETPAG